ncbi:platelet-activating factor acetylhydrolase [Cytidiella melzeri]|nr:platelet-activating factor acetylhydrolase [Cytidiella melzeri]
MNGIQRPTTSALHPTPEPPKLHSVPRHSPFGALLSRTLPNYTGKYEVGVCDLELPVPRQTFGTFKYKQMPDSDVAGIAMDTVLCSLFYPCERQEKQRGVAWFPKLAQTIDGFLKMAKRTPNVWYRMAAYPVAAAAIHGTTFPATKDATLANPPSELGKWPLMLFSHGVGCSRLMYSAFCGEMASRGFVVASLEHRDGTSPSSTIASEDGTMTIVDWLEWSDLYWPDLEEQPADDTTLRHAQIQLRKAELETLIDAIQKLSQGESVTRYSSSADGFDWSRMKNVDASKPIIAGHSLGGSAALASSSAGNIDYRAVIVFDPAVQRLEPWKSPLPHPLLMVNSEEFTVGREYAIFSEQIAHTATTEMQVYSIGGATHPSFSDVFLILPGAINKMTGLKCSSSSVINRAVKATEQFLSGPKGHGGKVTYDEEFTDEEDRKLKMSLRGATGKDKKRNEEEGEEKGGKLYRPVGRPGELAWHRL